MIFKKKKHPSRNQQIAVIREERKHILTEKSGFFQREAYKVMRTNVSFALADKEGCKVIAVTSALQSEGKSITSLNLAISLGQADMRVLIIDGDLRRPKLGRLLNLSAPVGLSNVLLDAGQLDLALITGDSHGIDVLLAGDIPPNPSELLTSAKMQQLLEKLRGEYDYIIIDTSPVDMVVDAVALAPLVDGLLFVVRANQSERGAVVQGIDQLQYVRANVLGFVLNGVDGEGSNKYRRYSRYNRYSYYGKRYGYGYGHRYGYYSYSKSEHRDRS